MSSGSTGKAYSRTKNQDRTLKMQWTRLMRMVVDGKEGTPARQNHMSNCVSGTGYYRQWRSNTKSKVSSLVTMIIIQVKKKQNKTM